MDQIHQFEQASAFIAESYPPMLRRFYLNLLNEGFTELQALELTKAYIISMGGIKL